VVPLLYPWRERGQSRWRVGRLRLMLIYVCCVVVFCVVLACIFCVVWLQQEGDKNKNVTDGAKQNWRAAGALRIFCFFLCVPEFWIYLL
jgi:hypothetical protein